MIEPSQINNTIISPTLPLCSSFPNRTSMQLGTMITISGTVTWMYAKRFQIELLSGGCEHSRYGSSSNVAFHLNPRFKGSEHGEHSDVVVLNSKIGNSWGAEQRESHFPFGVHRPFNLVLLAEERSFKVAVNGRHSYEFLHRTPFRNIVCMHISGDVTIHSVKFGKELNYLNPNPYVPMPPVIHPPVHHPPPSRNVVTPRLPYSEFDSRFRGQFDVQIYGKLFNLCRDYIVVNLAGPGGIIPFHVSIRPHQRVIVRNSFQYGKWQNEEKSLYGGYPLSLGSHFDLFISNRRDQISVKINGTLAFVFRHRIDPGVIDRVEINGSTEIGSVRYEFH